MNLFREVIAWLVAASGIMCWIVFVPQVRLLIKIKKSDSISTGMLWGSFGIQMLIMIHLAMQSPIDWRFLSSYIMSFIGLLVVMYFVYYYRRWPGGRKK